MTPGGLRAPVRADCLRPFGTRGGSGRPRSGYRPSSPSRRRPSSASTPTIAPFRRTASQLSQTPPLGESA
eukprot:7695576-Lingulodinium_polyedra.AAC.1